MSKTQEQYFQDQLKLIAENKAKAAAKKAAIEVSKQEVTKFLASLVEQQTLAGSISPRVMNDYLARTTDNDFTVLAIVRTFITSPLFGVLRVATGYQFKNEVFMTLNDLELTLQTVTGVQAIPGDNSVRYLVAKHLGNELVGNAELRRLLLPVMPSYDNSLMTAEDLSYLMGFGGF